MSRISRSQLIPFAILLLAVALRLSHLDLIEFKADEVRHCQRALQIVKEGHLPLVGSTASVGMAKPPLMTYLMAIPLAISRDPRVASVFIALLNVASVAGCYYLARAYFGPRAALIASLLYAVNPWAIIYSRKIFTADVLAPFTTTMFIGVYGALVRRQPWAIVLAVVSLACLLLITFSPIPLILVLFLLILLHPRRVRWPHLILGGVIALALFAPYLYYDYRHGFANIRGLLAGSGEGGQWSTRALEFATWIHSGYNFASHAGRSYPTYMDGRLPLGWLDLVAIGVLAAAFVYILARIAWTRSHHRDSSPYVILALWLAVPVAFSLRKPVQLHPHYFVVLYPAGFIAMGVVLDAALRWPRNRQGISFALQGAIWLLIGSIALWQVYVSQYTFAFVARHDTRGGYGLPFRFLHQATSLAMREARAIGVNEVWVVTEGTNVLFDEMPLIFNYLLKPTIKAVFLGQGGHTVMLLPVGRPAVYLITRESPEVLHTMRILGGEERGWVPFPGGRDGAHIYVLPALTKEEIISLPMYRRQDRLDAGLNLLGYDWPHETRAGQTIDLVTYWAFGDIPPSVRHEQHSLFNHLVDADGHRWAQHDGFGLPERYWSDGYVLMHWFELSLPDEMPSGNYYLLTGLYSLHDGRRSSLLDAGGRPVGDTIELGPLPIGR